MPRLFRMRKFLRLLETARTPFFLRSAESMITRERCWENRLPNITRLRRITIKANMSWLSPHHCRGHSTSTYHSMGVFRSTCTTQTRKTFWCYLADECATKRYCGEFLSAHVVHKHKHALKNDHMLKHLPYVISGGLLPNQCFSLNAILKPMAVIRGE